VFNNVENLTANPKEHIKRAQKLLSSKHNSTLLYAALELRFAVERMVKGELLFKEKVSLNTWRKRDPSIHARALRGNDNRIDNSYQIYFIAKRINEKIPVGVYKPFPLEKVKQIDGKLGDLLHANYDFNLGVCNDPWYIKTRRFLNETAGYLQALENGNTKFYAYADDSNYELVVKELGPGHESEQ